jgi:adenylate cyclase, class 2
MSQQEQEVEVKFYLNNLRAFEQRLKATGAELYAPRVHEINLRYDTPEGSLTRAHRVLRLRQDQRAVLTYKGPAEPGRAVSIRPEIEVEVSNFTSASHILEALGYQVLIMYEKERTTYALRDVRITLDEMPYGTFCELEGPDAEKIQTVANELDLDWEARVVTSYLEIFANLRERSNLKVRHLSFDEFKNITITPEQMGVRAADLTRSDPPLPQ